MILTNSSICVQIHSETSEVYYVPWSFVALWLFCVELYDEVMLDRLLAQLDIVFCVACIDLLSVNVFN